MCLPPITRTHILFFFSFESGLFRIQDDERKSRSLLMLLCTMTCILQTLSVLDRSRHYFVRYVQIDCIPTHEFFQVILTHYTYPVPLRMSLSFFAPRRKFPDNNCRKFKCSNSSIIAALLIAGASLRATCWSLAA